MADRPATEYRERLWTPVWWWPVSLLVVAVAGAELQVGQSTPWAIATYAAVAVVVLAFLLRLSAARVAVADGALQAGRARLPASSVGEVSALDRRATRQTLGPAADPMAFSYLRWYVPTAVVVRVLDGPGAPPYWVVSSRRPSELAAALRALRETAGRSTADAEQRAD